MNEKLGAYLRVAAFSTVLMLGSGALIFPRIKSGLEEYVSKFDKVVRIADVNKDGIVSEEECRKVYAKAGVEFEQDYGSAFKIGITFGIAVNKNPFSTGLSLANLDVILGN